jgi:hypothetical protein
MVQEFKNSDAAISNRINGTVERCSDKPEIRSLVSNYLTKIFLTLPRDGNPQAQIAAIKTICDVVDKYVGPVKVNLAKNIYELIEEPNESPYQAINIICTLFSSEDVVRNINRYNGAVASQLSECICFAKVAGRDQDHINLIARIMGSDYFFSTIAKYPQESVSEDIARQLGKIVLYYEDPDIVKLVCDTIGKYQNTYAPEISFRLSGIENVDHLRNACSKLTECNDDKTAARIAKELSEASQALELQKLIRLTKETGFPEALRASMNARLRKLG